MANAPSAPPAPGGVGVAGAPVGAPGGRQLYLSLSGTERDDWTKQLLVYGAVIFVSGVLIGRALQKGPKRYKTLSREEPVRKLTPFEIYQIDRRRRETP